MEESGAVGEPSARDRPVQMQHPSHEAHDAAALQGSRPIPRNFVWRLYGGRRTSLTSIGTTSTQSQSQSQSEGGDMAVDIPVLRHSFDPWSEHANWHAKEEQGDDGRCSGCTRISKARQAAAAAAAATRPLAITISPPVSPPDAGLPYPSPSLSSYSSNHGE
ncbi:hypothetical protein B0T17DRAFT_166644 [Bombardia bombarda]|uniref:Uncharacterized protein n=1 Tax=Bombardia bombarda TaxID=252184 RepID=A0AA39X7Y8_9PEZI|nr:hypothetical protein B0T17DRAFT_166644 [Bombardia bombarda]